MSAGKLKIRRLTPAIGAELTGVDLSSLPRQGVLDEIYAALVEYQVVFIRDQDISPGVHFELAHSFGEIQPPNPLYPRQQDNDNIMVLRSDADTPPDTGGWHTDVTYRQNPPFACFLVARTVPGCGGDTLWLSLSRAWDTLPAGIQSELEELNAVHDFGDFRNNFAVGEKDAGKLIQAQQEFGSAIHPVVKVHPATGRKFIYVNESFTQQIVGLRAAESNRMLDYLYRHIEQPENQVRFQWSAGAMAIWDNRCTWHYATTDYLPQAREMHRITVINDARIP